MLTVIATRDFQSSAGLHVAGTIVAEINTAMTSGELASILRTRADVTVESDAEEQTADDVDDADADHSETQAQSQTPGDDQSPDPLTRPLADLIESKPAKLLADNDPSINTVGELAAWIALGNRPSQVSGIGPATESEILDATELKL